MVETPSTQQLPDIEEGQINLRKILIQFGIGLLLLMISLALVGYYFRQPLLNLSNTFVKTFGAYGVALGFFLPDAFTIPFPNDAFTFLGLQGGLGFWECVIWGSAGSLLGGTVGFWIGRLLGTTQWMINFFRSRGSEAYAITRRYGLVALAIAAFTPIPYSIVCWACGAVAIKFRHFLLISLLRIPRVALYLWLIQLGFISMPTPS